MLPSAAVNGVLNLLAATVGTAWLVGWNEVLGRHAVVAMDGDPVLAKALEPEVVRLRERDSEVRVDGVDHPVEVRELPSGYRLGVLREHTCTAAVARERMEMCAQMLRTMIANALPAAPLPPTHGDGGSGAPALIGLQLAWKRRT